MLAQDVEMFIIQISRPQDRSEAELAMIADGVTPIMVFADGPDKAFLVGAKPDDLAAAMADAKTLADGYGADRLARRMRIFSGLSDAINTQFKYLADPSDFPNGVVILFAEALVQYGLEDPADLVPCAVRFLRANLELPDFEEAPSDDLDLSDSDSV